MKKIIVLTLCLLLTGCNQKELNKLGIINQIGLEYQNNEYHLYASVIKEIDKDLNIKKEIIEVKDKNINSLFKKINLSLNKKIYLSHLDLLVINQTIKYNQIKDITNYFINNKESRYDFLIITTNNIKDILLNTKKQEINDLISLNEEYTYYTTMYDLLINYYLNKPIILTNIIYQNNIKINGYTIINNNDIGRYNENI